MVSLRDDKAILSLPRLYRSCAEVFNTAILVGLAVGGQPRTAKQYLTPLNLYFRMVVMLPSFRRSIVFWRFSAHPIYG